MDLIAPDMPTSRHNVSDLSAVGFVLPQHVTRATLVLLLFMLTPCWSQAFAAETPEQIEAGRKLAVSLCSGCHTVSRDHVNGPRLRPRAPSFPAMADQARLTDDEFKKFLSSPHGFSSAKRKMPPLPLPQEYIDALAAYLHSLKRAP